MEPCPVNTSEDCPGLHALQPRMRFPRIQRPRFSDHRFEWLGIRYACAYCDAPATFAEYEENWKEWSKVP